MTVIYDTLFCRTNEQIWTNEHWTDISLRWIEKCFL